MNARNFTKLLLVTPLVASVGCAFYARSPEDYRSVTRELVETRNADIKECYDVALQTDEKVGGRVTVNFQVEQKTGKIINVAPDSSATTAPENLTKCVVSAIENLQLDPADARDGMATFTWSFEAGAPAPAEG
ncbi:hypothetical protein PPSIR1_09705 [Plesiocystis pacifica SIR-1]|uniref:Uncharacterized protein n=1 Tax=Plesiocystis pacifica SIR-1 TaxID=391625 RepID=A6GK90_9BACT|nr:AgmX/PglI C-terminal domain-containing protein [Plesiocystis pacifica]EDM73712.1 hypothetical protein PPSIR1_09705 [Plesiocystis pacifica SIR-1]